MMHIPNITTYLLIFHLIPNIHIEVLRVELVIPLHLVQQLIIPLYLLDFISNKSLQPMMQFSTLFHIDRLMGNFQLRMMIGSFPD